MPRGADWPAGGAECREELIGHQVARVKEDEAPSGLDMLDELTTLNTRFAEHPLV